jgi:hypothetical protein
VTIFSGRALDDELSKIQTTLANTNAEWKLRMEVRYLELEIGLTKYFTSSNFFLLVTYPSKVHLHHFSKIESHKEVAEQ